MGLSTGVAMFRLRKLYARPGNGGRFLSGAMNCMHMILSGAFYRKFDHNTPVRYEQEYKPLRTLKNNLYLSNSLRCVLEVNSMYAESLCCINVAFLIIHKHGFFLLHTYSHERTLIDARIRFCYPLLPLNN